MTQENLLNNKKVLIVDDEPDILETLEDLLSMCDVTKASSFEEAKDLIEKQHFDLAILDIMGVDGYGLLKKASEKDIIVVMLTAHAMDVENLSRSYKQGAASFIPKDKMTQITTFLTDILEAQEKGRNFWRRSLGRLESYFDEQFGSGWQEMYQFKIDKKE